MSAQRAISEFVDVPDEDADGPDDGMVECVHCEQRFPENQRARHIAEDCMGVDREVRYQ